MSIDWNAIWAGVEKERERPRTKPQAVEHEWELCEGDFDAGVPDRWQCKHCDLYTDDNPAQHQWCKTDWNAGEYSCLYRQVKLVMES